jgi:hypothetical protein
MSHYKEDLTQAEYEEKYNAAEALVFGENATKKVYCSLESLDGVVELGCGKDEQESRENYVHKIEMLIHELNEKRIKVQYEQVQLDYTTVGEV